MDGTEAFRVVRVRKVALERIQAFRRKEAEPEASVVPDSPEPWPWGAFRAFGRALGHVGTFASAARSAFAFHAPLPASAAWPTVVGTASTPASSCA